jgi:DNA phosphorothioation-dependent restriction protein DptG
MTDMQQLMYQTFAEIEEVIDLELRPRLQALGRDIDSWYINDDGTVNVVIKKISSSLFNVNRDVLEKIVVSKLKLCIPRIQKVIISWQNHFNKNERRW